MRKFDLGYSEVTFSKIAVEVHAAEAIIHKEYHLSSADPMLVGVDKAIPVGDTNFVVADQLGQLVWRRFIRRRRSHLSWRE
jgi:aspartate kinase